MDRVEILDDPEDEPEFYFPFGDTHPGIVNLILWFGSRMSLRNTNGLYKGNVETYQQAAIEIMCKNRKFHESTIVPYMRNMMISQRVYDVVFALSCWHLVRDGKAFDLDIEVCEIHAGKRRIDRHIHLDEVTTDRPVMWNGGRTDCYFMGDAFFFCYEHQYGIMYNGGLYKICSIKVPGYEKKGGNSAGFAMPQEGDCLTIVAHHTGKTEGVLQEIYDKEKANPTRHDDD